MAELQEELLVFEQKHNCVQEEPPYCTDACPLGVDARQMMALVQQDKLEAAFELYRKSVLFPAILCRVCTQPCRSACLRAQYDEAVQVRQVERALAEYAPRRNQRHYIRAKNKRVAVVGAGLSGMACAVTLAQKGYAVTVYDSAPGPGGRLAGLPGLPPDTVRDELSQAAAFYGVTLVLGKTIVTVDEPGADALLLATGTQDGLATALGNIDPETLAAATPGRFAAGGAAGIDAAPEQRIASGRLAARSIDRFLSGSPLSSGQEAHCPTRLFTPHRADISPTPAQQPGQDGIYTKAQLGCEAGRCLLCECKACVPHCLLLEQGLQYPKQYIVEAQQSLRTLKLLQSKLRARRTNACNLCGLCKEYCPGGVDMGEVYLYSRRIMHKRGELPPAFHAFWLDDMAFAASDEAFLCRAQPGFEQVSYLFFPGCQMGGAGPDNVLAGYQYLANRLPGGVGLYLGCCGAPSEWAGYEALTQAELARFARCHEALGRPTVILACPSCQKMFERYHPDVEQQSLWEVVERCGLPDTARNGAGQTLALFDPCASRYRPGDQQAVRRLASAMGYTVEELPHHGRTAQCCGYGGLIYASNPDMADAVARDRVSQSERPYLSYCVNCCEIFKSEGKPTWYLPDLLFGHGSRTAEARGPIGLSVRRDNRRALRGRLLAEVWKEDAMEQPPNRQHVRLEIDDALRAKMDRALILEDHLKQVVAHAEATGEKLEQDGRYITHLKIGYITYWVFYSPLPNGGWRLDNTYCHRMQIEEEEAGKT